MSDRSRAHRWAWLLLVIGAATVVLGTAAGSQGWQAWWSVPVDAVSRQIVWDIRLPRSLGAWLGGGLLGLAGAVAQGLFRNPLADPYLLGSASGASLGVGTYLSLFGGSAWAVTWWMGLGLTGAAFVGAVLAVLLTLMLARGVQQTLRLLLAGVVVGVVLGAVTSMLSLLQPQVLQAMQGFMLGSTAFVSWTACTTMAVVLALCMGLAWTFARVLDALTLGESTAQTLGVPLRAARLVLVGVISLATAAAVAHIGLVAFVGLAAPHLVRSLLRCTHAWSLLLAALMGGALLSVADVLARVLFAPQELPVGVLTAVLGGGYLLWRVYRDTGHGSGTGGAMSYAMETRHLTVSLGARTVLNGIDLQIAAGRWTCVLGPNGAGKSTLLKSLAGLLPHSGQVFWQGQRLDAIARRQRGVQLSWLGQGEASTLDLRVWDVAMLGRLPHQGWLGAPTPQDRQMVESALKATQAWDWRERTLGELSGGERQRVLLARAMAGNAPLMLMDEPLANLDPPHQVDWLEQVHCLTAQGTTVVSVLHEVGMALHADEIIVMDQGQVVHHGACRDASTHAAIEAVFGHRIRIGALDGQWAVLPHIA